MSHGKSGPCLLYDKVLLGVLCSLLVVTYNDLVIV